MEKQRGGKCRSSIGTRKKRPRVSVPYLLHNLSRAHLPSMDGTVNATFHSSLDGKKQVGG